MEAVPPSVGFGADGAEIPTTYGPLTQKVLEFTAIVTALAAEAKERSLEADDWAPLAELVDTRTFHRVGIWREEMSWPEYVEFLSQFASAKGFESRLRRVAELSGAVYFEIEERHSRDGKVNVVNSMNVFEFSEAGKIRRLDVYIQGRVEPSTSTNTPPPPE